MGPQDGRRCPFSTRLITALVAGLLAIGSAVVAMPAADASGASRVYTYEVRGLGNTSDLGAFATAARQTYWDVRGWSLGGAIEFRRVASGGDFTLWLASATHVPDFGSVCDSLYSCRAGRNVVINESRWLGATPSWNAAGGSLRDYRHMVINHETGHWLGFGHATCGGVGQRAPVMQQQSISLQACHFNPWPLASERQALAGRVGVAIRVGVPLGSLELVTPAFAAIRVHGWSVDPDSSNPTRVHVYVDGVGHSLTAALSRPDVALLLPGKGTAHGFDVQIPTTPGTHTLCAFVPNLVGPGSTLAMGCRTVTVSGSPSGHVDSISAAAGSVRMTGWMIDPDTAAAGRVHVYVDTRGTSRLASLWRPDVQARYPRFGGQHGFDVTVSATAGAHRVCVYAMNAAGSGSTVNLGCRAVSVPAS